MQRVQAPVRRRVGAQFKNARVFRVRRFDFRRIIRGGHEKPVHPGDEPAVGFGFLRDFLPFRVGPEFFPRLVRRCAARVLQHIDEFVVRIVHRRPVADVFHAVLFENPHRMIPETRVERVQFARRGVINAQFVAASVGGADRGNAAKRRGQEEKGKGFHDGESTPREPGISSAT